MFSRIKALLDDADGNDPLPITHQEPPQIRILSESFHTNRPAWFERGNTRLTRFNALWRLHKDLPRLAIERVLDCHEGASNMSSVAVNYRCITTFDDTRSTVLQD